jgi:hypothetical protein
MRSTTWEREEHIHYFHNVLLRTPHEEFVAMSYGLLLASGREAARGDAAAASSSSSSSDALGLVHF